MKATDNIKDIFSILHDGTISDWTGDKERLTLKVECQYLAERIDKTLTSFFIDLKHIDKLQLTTWPNPIDRPVRVLTEIADIFKAELEILSVEKKEHVVVVACNQFDPAFEYSGGNLSISCEEIIIYDQNRNELTIDQVDNLSKDYWIEMGKKIEQRIIERKNQQGRDK